MIAFLISICFAALIVVDNLHQNRTTPGPRETREPVELPKAA